ncbi:MAG: hypothetical protein ACRC62_30045 [Microcoleus sp.]
MSKYIPLVVTIIVFAAVLPAAFNAKQRTANSQPTQTTAIAKCAASVGAMDADICK